MTKGRFDYMIKWVKVNAWTIVWHIISARGKQMKNKRWKEFGKLTGKCYVAMGTGVQGDAIWNQTFEALKAVIADERSSKPENAAELYLLDEITDYEYDVQGWLEDYLDELDMGKDKEKLLKVCDELLEMFRWEEEAPTDIKFLKSSALSALGRKDEAVEFCKEWLKEEPDNLESAAANIYALLEVNDMETAERLIKQYIQEDAECTDENDVLFEAAVAYYKKAGNKKEMKRLDKAREEYNKQIAHFLLEFDGNEGDEFIWDDEDEDGDFLWDDEDLPFS